MGQKFENTTKAEDASDDLKINYPELVNHSYRVLALWLKLSQRSLGGTLKLTTASVAGQHIKLQAPKRGTGRRIP